MALQSPEPSSCWRFSQRVSGCGGVSRNTARPAAPDPCLEGPRAAAGAEGCFVLFLLLEPIHSPETCVAGSRARIARPHPRRSMAPTTAPPNTHAPMPQQPRRPHGLAAPAGPDPGPLASGTQMTRKKSPTLMVSSCRQPRLLRLPGEWCQWTAQAVDPQGASPWDWARALVPKRAWEMLVRGMDRWVDGWMGG